jgi:hypothetical protein
VSFGEIVDHYQRLLDTAQYLDASMSWTAIQSLTGPLSVEDVAERVAGHDAEIRVMDVAEGPLDVPAIPIADCGSSIMLLDGPWVIVPWAQGVMEKLSEAARLWNVAWHFNGGHRLTYAVDGRVLVAVPALEPAAAHGVDPHALDHVLRLLPDRFTGSLSKASAMAIIEMDSGAYLDLEWLATDQTAVILGSGE